MESVTSEVMHDFIAVPIQLGGSVKHELFIRVNGSDINDIIVMASGIARGAENDKTYDPAWSSPLWLDAAGAATFRTSPTGMGKSEGDTYRSTLGDRVSVTVEAAKYAKKQYPNATLTLVGGSMGGHVAVRAANELAKKGIIVGNLVLSSPCFYSDAAERATYGDEFRTVSALPKTSQNLNDFMAVKQLLSFPGKVFIFYQEHEANMDRGGVKDIDLVMNVVEDVMEKRAVAGREDRFFLIPGGEHSFKFNDVSPDPTTVLTHPGSADKLRVTNEAMRFIGLG